MKKKTILVIDDDATNRKLMETILKNKGGYEVIEASNGLEGLDKLNPDISLIFLDLIMPVIDGIKFLEIIKTEKPEFANIPVIVLTTDDSKKQQALQAGAKEVIIKPVNPVDILEKVVAYSS
jgi:two-component system chemotaxis response regulator CheY/putative two-component system response regulator